MSNILNKIKGDHVIWAVVFALSLFSILAVYSSSGAFSYARYGGNTEFYIIKHFVILFFGLVLMYLTHKINYSYFSPVIRIALWVCVVLLILTLFIGKDLNDAKRVLPLPFGLSFQTSDLAKLALIIYLSRILTLKDELMSSQKDFFKMMIPVFLIILFIFPANFSTAALVFCISLVMLFLGKVENKYLFEMIGIGFVGVVLLLLVMFLVPESKLEKGGRIITWKHRIENFVEPKEVASNTNVIADDDYQVMQSKIAIATGGLIGKGPGKSTQRNFLPHPYSDFIFAIIVEEYGLLGGAFVVLLYLILLFRAVIIVTKAPQTFGSFLAIGVAFSLVFQAMFNMGVAVGLLPVTGQPLPLVSMGGTSIWFTSLSIGIMLSVSKQMVKKEKEKQEKILQNAVETN